MFSKSTIVAIAATLGAVNASPLLRRQETGVTSVVSSVVSSALSTASGVPSDASSAISSVGSAASSAVSSVSSVASSGVASATSTGSAAAATATALGEQAFPLFPCAPGYLLTYAQVNETIPISVLQAGQAAGEWATSPLFPNVTNATGGTTVGATHTISVMDIAINEVLVNATSNSTSGFAEWIFNNTAPFSAGNVTIDTYQTVFRIYDPDFTTTQEIGNTTFAQIFTNACANDQAAAQPLLETLGGLELQLLGEAISGAGANATEPAATTSASPVASATSSASSAVESASSVASSAAVSATSVVSSAASGVVASATSLASALTSAAAGAVSSSSA